VNVVKILWVLPVEEDAAVTMAARVLSAHYAEGEHEVGDLKILDQSDVVRATNLWSVVAAAPINAEDLVTFDFTMGPAFLISSLPALTAFLKVFTENKGQVGLWLCCVKGIFQGGQESQRKDGEELIFHQFE
jgi:hypothetical protein